MLTVASALETLLVFTWIRWTSNERSWTVPWHRAECIVRVFAVNASGQVSMFESRY